jgi:hypothetical protein
VIGVRTTNIHCKEVRLADPNISRRLDTLSRDNLVVVERPYRKVIVGKLLPWLNRKLRTTRLPDHLDELEQRYAERVDWPRSRFNAKRLQSAANAFEDTLATPQLLDRDYNTDVVEAGFAPAVTASRHDLDLVGRDLSKSAGLPTFGSKLENLGAAKQYNLHVKSNPVLKECYPYFNGFRTQMASPDDFKVRLVWMCPCHMFLLQIEGYSDAIRNAQANWTQHAFSSPFYFDLATLKSKFDGWEADSNELVVLDATAFDASVHREEVEQLVRHNAGSYEFVDLLVDYERRAEVLTPEGYVERDGGKSSGDVDTNLLDGQANVWDIVSVFERLKLLRYLEHILVNGDDVILFLSTKLTDNNLLKIGKHSLRSINADKSDRRQRTSWFSKLYLDPELDRPTKPLNLVCNSLSFQERFSDPARSGRASQALSATMILSYAEGHPLFDEFVREFKRYEKYPLSSLPDEQVVEAAELWLADHGWAVDVGQVPSSAKEFANSLRKKWDSY